MPSRDDFKQSNSKEKEEDEEANAYLMTHSNTKKVITSDSRQTCKNMKIMFDNLLEDTNVLSKKCLFQKDKISKLKKRIGRIKYTSSRNNSEFALLLL